MEPGSDTWCNVQRLINALDRGVGIDVIIADIFRESPDFPWQLDRIFPTPERWLAELRFARSHRIPRARLLWMKEEKVRAFLGELENRIAVRLGTSHTPFR
jgi:hypothetical protein